MDDGTCADAMASNALQAKLGNDADFVWQRSPFEIGEVYGREGGTQSPGLALIDAF